MSIHTKSVFKNTCVKTPINPFNKRPCPNYERHVRPNSNKQNIELKICDETRNSELLAKDNIFSLVEFYDSIPGKFFFS